MTWLFILFLALASEVWSQNGSNKGQCCYLYGTVPRNDSNCVPEGRQFLLNCIVYNPRDEVTNFTVRWFKSTNLTRGTGTSSAEAVNSAQGEFISIRNTATRPSLISNCTSGTLYRDTFSLVIYNFTTDKNGYYWCQIVVNCSLLQPSHYAWFYADGTNSCELQHHFKLTDEAQCANTIIQANIPNVYSIRPSSATSDIFSLSLSPSAFTHRSTDTTPTTFTPTHGTESTISYTIGILIALVVILGSLVLVLSLPYIYKCRRMKAGTARESVTISANHDATKDSRKGSRKEEDSMYQTLNLDELNYESMYAKITQTSES